MRTASLNTKIPDSATLTRSGFNFYKRSLTHPLRLVTLVYTLTLPLPRKGECTSCVPTGPGTHVTCVVDPGPPDPVVTVTPPTEVPRVSDTLKVTPYPLPRPSPTWVTSPRTGRAYTTDPYL